MKLVRISEEAHRAAKRAAVDADVSLEAWISGAILTFKDADSRPIERNLGELTPKAERRVGSGVS